MSGVETPAKVLVAGGGTAGHLIPGLAVAAALVDTGLDQRDIVFAGGDRGVERELVTAAGYTLYELPGRGIQRRLTLANVRAMISLVRGTVMGIGLVRRLRPRVVVVLGGYASFGCGVGAALWRRPLVLCEQNARAGAVNRALRFFARRSAVSFPGTDLPRSEVTGNPLRAEIVAAARRRDADPVGSRGDARRELGLGDDRVVVLVTTGSLGSARVNGAIRGLVAAWADRSDVAVRHVVGRRDFAAFTADPPATAPGGLDYQLIEYEDRMETALAAADVVVARSGGGVAEFAALGVPAVLVPLPIAPRDHQRANAAHLVDAGGAVLVDDDECTAEVLAAVLGPIVDDAQRRATMADAMRDAARPDAAEAAARLILEVVDGH
ncbi:MAG: glycosyltransferase [Actinobacteria bacterium]|nr:glycosyltransferase [Actinomycetota bacterium]